MLPLHVVCKTNPTWNLNHLEVFMSNNTNIYYMKNMK